MQSSNGIPTIEELIQKGKEVKASDIHFVVGLPIKFRMAGVLESVSAFKLTDEMCEEYARALTSEAELERIKDRGEIDTSGSFADNRCRINIFRQQGHLSIALRILSESIPSIESLGLPAIAASFATLKRGIVLFTGETGSGKSTSLAAIINEINRTRKDHVITLEDPIEYVYEPKLSVINQREIGGDTESYASGLRAILREDPDVILIGEMRDLTSIEIAMTAAETGHLVFATLHTNSAADTVDRIVSTFPESSQSLARIRLASSLHAVVSQQLLPKKNGPGRVLAYEVMIVNSAIAAHIREGKTEQINNALQINQAAGCSTMDDCLLSLYKKGYISQDACITAAHFPTDVKKNILLAR